MEMNSDNRFELFCQNSLFKELTKEELKALFSISKEVVLNPGDCLIQEGDQADDIFFILEGSLEISKYDPINKESHVIGTVHAGNSIGEIALLDRGPRSASAKAISMCLLRKIPYVNLLALVEKNPKLNSLFFHLASNVSQRLRHTDDVVFEALKAKVDEYKTRNQMGSYLVILITVLCIIAYSIPGLKAALASTSNSSYISIPIIVFFGTSMYLLNKLFNFPYRVFGITLEHWKQSVFEGFVFTIPVLAFLTLAKWLVIQFVPAFQGEPLFKPFFLVPDPASQTLHNWLLMQLYYVLFIPIQELMVRGGLQSLLERFLIGKHKVALSIFASSLMFGTGHLFLPVHIGIIIFLAGLYFGWLYSRTHNLISPIIAHALVGIWGLSVLGL